MKFICSEELRCLQLGALCAGNVGIWSEVRMVDRGDIQALNDSSDRSRRQIAAHIYRGITTFY